MMGCSNGGRHAMVAATRFADRYDGFIAGDPGFDLPRAAIQHAWDVQSFRSVDPDIRKSFAPADMALIARKVLEKCDALDGVADGMVNDLARLPAEIPSRRPAMHGRQDGRSACPARKSRR